MTLKEFLEELVEHKQHEFDAPQKIERWKRIAYLTYCNGGSFNVSGWGITGYSGGIFKEGLTQSEAMELIFISGVIEGSCWYDKLFQTVYIPMINVWIKELQEKYKLSEEGKN
jgi:hypothetical protein